MGTLTNNADFQFQFAGNGTGLEPLQYYIYIILTQVQNILLLLMKRSVQVNQTPNNHGTAGGGVNTVASASDGIQFRLS